MELGQGGITTLTFVPEYDGNSSLPDDERLSVQIIPFRAADQMASMNQTTERLQQWRDDELKDWLDSPEFGAQIRRFSIEVLLTMRLFVEHVTKPRNFYNNGVPIEDPVELFLRLPFPINSQREVMAWGIIQSLVDADTGERLVEVQQAAKDMIEANADSGITQEIVAAIRKTQGLSGDALKNLVSVFDGSLPPGNLSTLMME